MDASPGRFLLGIAGPPGAGKTRLAEALEQIVNDRRGEVFTALAPMDGFHLRNETLDARGLRSVKGAPQTFDVQGFVNRLRLMRTKGQDTVQWPAFDRALDEPTPGAIEITPTTKLVITEGNYLLLDQPGWREVRPLLDEVWYVDAPREVLRKRLIERQIAGGRTEDEAVEHVDGSDLPNAELVAPTRSRATRMVLSP